MKRALTLAIASVLVAGCAPPVYVRPNTSMAEFDRDISQCQYEAASSTAGYGSGQNTARTYGGAIGQGIGIGIGRAIESNNLVALCMRAHGYQRGGPSVGGYPALASEPASEIIVAPEYQRGAAPAATPMPIASTPFVAVSLKAESKYFVTAEGVAKATGCAPPSVAMTAKGAGSESFMVGCPNGTTLAMRCEIDGCRILR